MTRAPAARHGSKAITSSLAGGPRPRLLPAAAAAIIALVVFRGALGAFFSQDDFAALGRAAGLLPRFTEPWRWLALQGFFDLMRPLAGTHPGPYHAVSLALHALNAALVAALLARALTAPAALVGAAFIAAHAASFTAVYWISTVGDLGALLLGLLALATALRLDRARWWALPLFAASLLCKESVLLLPVCVAAVSAWWRPRMRASAPFWPRDPLLWAMALLAVAYLAYFARAQQLGPGMRAPGGAPYAIGLGPHLLGNLLTYAGWTVNAFFPTVRGWSDAVDRAAFPWGWAALVLWGAGAFWPALRRRGWIAAGICFAALLLPVLPLAHHTYHYYLYAPLAPAAWCVAALFAAVQTLTRSRAQPGGGHDWRAALVLAALLAANGAALVGKIESAPFMHPELRAEPVVDRARIARQVARGLARAELPPGTTLAFWSPEARSTAGPAQAETYWEQNVRTALYDGVAVRVLFPNVRAVRFATSPPAATDSALVAVYRVTGFLEVVPAAALRMPRDR